MREVEIVEECERYMERYLLSEKKILYDMAKAIGYNPSYLSRTYKKITGTNLMECYRKRKMEKATELMQNGMNTTEVAALLEYSKNGFTKAYKKTMGINPSRVKKQNKGE